MKGRGTQSSAFLCPGLPSRGSALGAAAAAPTLAKRSCPAALPPRLPDLLRGAARCSQGARAPDGGGTAVEQRWGERPEEGLGEPFPVAGSLRSSQRSGCSLCSWSSLILRETMFTDRVLIDLTS